LGQRIKESTMNRSLIVFAGVTSMLTLVLSTQISISAELGAPARIRTAANQKLPHRVAVQVDVNDPAVMNLALNNVSDVAQHYRDVGEKVDIEVVAFGPGLHMLRDDTRENMTRIEAKEVPLISQAKVVKAGVVRLMELKEQGWTYLRP
jgi:uncharacterized protein